MYVMEIENLRRPQVGTHYPPLSEDQPLKEVLESLSQFQLSVTHGLGECQRTIGDMIDGLKNLYNNTKFTHDLFMDHMRMDSEIKDVTKLAIFEKKVDEMFAKKLADFELRCMETARQYSLPE